MYLFASLDPDPALTALVAGYKREVFDLVGDQKFLHDPPHLTLYPAHFAEAQPLIERLAALARRTPAPELELCGWHVFFGDVATGGNTLVCRIADADKVRLRQFQAKVICELAPLRNVATTEDWLAPRLERHTPQERESIRQFGAPFTGDLWQPHVTVASIHPTAWDAVWSRLEHRAPLGRFRCPHLHLSQIHQDRPPTLLASAPFA